MRVQEIQKKNPNNKPINDAYRLCFFGLNFTHEVWKRSVTLEAYFMIHGIASFFICCR